MAKLCFVLFFAQYIKYKTGSGSGRGRQKNNTHKDNLHNFTLALLKFYLFLKTFKYDLSNYTVKLMIIKAKDLNEVRNQEVQLALLESTGHRCESRCKGPAATCRLLAATADALPLDTLHTTFSSPLPLTQPR